MTKQSINNLTLWTSVTNNEKCKCSGPREPTDFICSKSFCIHVPFGCQRREFHNHTFYNVDINVPVLNCIQINYGIYCDNARILYRITWCGRISLVFSRFSLCILQCGLRGDFPREIVLICSMQKMSFSSLLEKENRLLALDFCDELYGDESHILYQRAACGNASDPWISHGL